MRRRKKRIMKVGGVLVKSRSQLDGIRESGKINTAVLDYVQQNICAGISTEEIDQWVYRLTTEMGAVPAPLNFEGFPKSVCTSLNSVVCHGIPDERVILKEGDIINVDVSTIYHGYFSDSSRMFCIGEVSPEKKKLVDVVKECVELGLKEVKPWGFLGDMAHAVQTHAEENGYSVVQESLHGAHRHLPLRLPQHIFHGKLHGRQAAPGSQPQKPLVSSVLFPAKQHQQTSAEYQ